MTPRAVKVAAVLMVPAAAAWAILTYTCWAIVTGASMVIDLISRSL